MINHLKNKDPRDTKYRIIIIYWERAKNGLKGRGEWIIIVDGDNRGRPNRGGNLWNFYKDLQGSEKKWIFRLQ